MFKFCPGLSGFVVFTFNCVREDIGPLGVHSELWVSILMGEKCRVCRHTAEAVCLFLKHMESGVHACACVC